MNGRPGAVLFVDADAYAVDAFRDALADDGATWLSVAHSHGDALRQAHEQTPELVVAGPTLSHDDAVELRRALRLHPPLGGALYLRLAPADSPTAHRDAVAAGFDGYLGVPADRGTTLACVRALQRAGRAEVALREERQELQRLHHAVDQGVDQVRAVLAQMLDRVRPGSGDRGARIATLGLRIAGRFGIPLALWRDLEIAAQLHELGRIAGQDGAADDGGARADWIYAQSTAAMLMPLDGLRTAGELIGGMYENWDGSGHPQHLQLGQIPLRTRILRILADYHAALERDPRLSHDGVLEKLEDHTGRCYDPMVLVHLRAALEERPDEGQTPRLLIPIESLHVGMRLTEDLCTDAGIKLLSRGTLLTQTTIETIRRRHEMDPITQGAAIART